MKPVVDKETALLEMAEWADFFETDLDESTISSVLPAAMRGRISLETENETFKVQLRKPVEKENGEAITTVILREPTTGETQKANKVKDEVAIVSHLLSAVSGLPLGIISRIGQKDFIVLSGLMGFFV